MKNTEIQDGIVLTLVSLVLTMLLRDFINDRLPAGLSKRQKQSVQIVIVCLVTVLVFGGATVIANWLSQQ